MPLLSRSRGLLLCVLIAISLALGLGSSARGDSKSFKKAWSRASKSDGDARRDAQLAALNGIGAEDDAKLAKLLPALALDSTLDYRVRDAAEDALCKLRGPAVEAYFSDALGAGGKRPREKRAERRVVICHVLGRRAGSDAAARGLLLAALGDKQDSVAVAALRGVREVKDKAVVGALVELLARAEGRLAADARSALQRITGQSFASPAEWQSFWEAKGSSWTPDSVQAPEEAPQERRLTTRTRLEPPKGGTTIYGTVTSSKVLFVVDVSGSMQVRAQDTTDRIRTRLDYVRRSLAGVIEAQIDDKDEFNVLSFSTGVKLFNKKSKLLKGNAANKKKAAGWVRRLQPEDGTNVYLALERAFQIPGIDTIYFLSDGSPSEGTSIVTEEILGQVRKWNSGRGVRIHTIGFLVGDGSKLGIVQDKSMAKGFLEALAKNNDGSVRFFE
jgi:VWA domain-containing protein